MHDNCDVVFRIVFDRVVEKFIFNYLTIDELIDKLKQIDEILINKLIEIHFKNFKIND